MPGEEFYYNFEFNCIGVIHLAYGTGRNKRIFVDPKIIERIKIKSSLGDKPFHEKEGNFEWEMMIRIPMACLAFDKIKTFSGLKGKANFYKCADGSKEPHYLTWNPVLTGSPDYHRPEFFGNIEFE